MVAGLTLAAYLLPAAIGDASLAGLPPQAGLYACLFGGLAFWLFCSSTRTVLTVTSALSLLVGASVGESERGRSRAPCHVGGLHGAAGRRVALRGVAGSCRNAIVNFFSETVLVGFKCGLALYLASTQLPKLFGFGGTTATSGTEWATFSEALMARTSRRCRSGFVALVLLLVGKRALKGWPVALSHRDWRHRGDPDPES